MNRSRRFAVLAVVAVLSVLSPAHAADLLVSSALNNQVLRYRGNTGVFVSAFVPAGANGLSAPAGLAFSRDGDFHVAGGDDNAVLRYDGVTGASIDVFATAEMHGPAGIAVGRDGHLYVSSRLDDRVLRYHGTTGAFNNTVVQNGFNGFFLGDAVSDEIFLVNNLVVANGTTPGTTGGRFGLLRESTAPGTGPGTRGLAILHRNMFYGNTAGDIGNVIQTLDGGDNGNRTTRGNEAESCFGGGAGCPGAVAGCTFPDCGVLVHPLDHIFVAPVDVGGDFRLVAGSPAIGAGADSLFQAGAERVPTVDFEGDPRAEGLPAIGFDERP